MNAVPLSLLRSTRLSAVALALLLSVASSGWLPAQAAKVTSSPGVHVVGADINSQEVVALLKLFQELQSASNAHSLEVLLSHYSPRFVSGDNLTLEQVQHLIEETWKLYPDIRYDSKVLEIRINGDWATLESIDSAKATAKAEAVLGNVPGQLESRSRGLLFLHRVGRTWEIVSDATLYESATILYGDARQLKLSLSAPDQVFAGEPYTARVDSTMPPGAFAIASIAKDPLVYPQRTPEEKFRSLSDEQTSLERVFQANHSNHNEMVTATIGLTQVGQDDQERPTVKLNGIATIVKRVNVLPKGKIAQGDGAVEEGGLVRWSASRLIDLTKAAANASSSDDDTSTVEIIQMPEPPAKETP